MTLQIRKSQVEALGFDLSEAVITFRQALDHHALTVDVPAPATEPIVEAIVRYHGDQFAVIDDTPTPPPSFNHRQKTWLEFMDLFTPEEQITLAGAAMTTPELKLWYDRAMGATYIDLDHERTIAGMQALVDANLIIEVRRNQVLAASVPDTAA
jgi:hypothetical protein